MGEECTCYGVEDRKARKVHKCYECRGIIRQGETYNYHHGVFDGSGFSVKVCTDCEELIEDCNLLVNDSEDRVSFGELHNWVDGAQDHHPELLARFVEIQKKRAQPKQKG